MSIMDAKLEFSDAQLISASSASTVSGTNEFVMSTVYDAWGTSITNDIGEGNNGLVVNFSVATALNASAYVVAKVYHHTASGVTSGAVLGTTTFAAADVAGTRKSVRIPAGTVNKWMGVQYSTVGSNMTTGAMNAWLSLDSETPST